MNNKGVTLIELLIVIVVIGIIATFAVPAVGDIITNSEKDAVLQDARALADQARLLCGQGKCSTAQEGTSGITYSQLLDMLGDGTTPGTLEVFDRTKYEETDADVDGADDAILKKTDGVWTVQLTKDSTNGEYTFGDTNDGTGYADPITATRDNVH